MAKRKDVVEPEDLNLRSEDVPPEQIRENSQADIHSVVKPLANPPRVGLETFYADDGVRFVFRRPSGEVVGVEQPWALQVKSQAFGVADIYLLYPSIVKNEPRIAMSTFDGLILQVVTRIDPETKRPKGFTYQNLYCGGWSRFSFPETPENRYVRYLCTVSSPDMDFNSKNIYKNPGVPSVKQFQQYPTLASKPELLKK